MQIAGHQVPEGKYELHVKQRRLTRIRDGFVHDLGSRRQHMRLQLPTGEDMLDADIVGDKMIAEQSSMAVPVVALGTHDGGSVATSDLQEFRHTLTELVGGHVVGVVAKALVLDATVRRRRGVLGSLAIAAQSFQPVVLDAFLLQRNGKAFPTEVRMSAGGWVASNIDQCLDAVSSGAATGTCPTGGCCGRW